jgi:uncharacterized protein involved in outer membrane biogenesis
MGGARLKRLCITVSIVVLAVLLVLLFAPGLLICPAVGKAGSLALGVPVRLKDAGLRIFSSSVDLRGFEVGNPEGYTTKNAIEVGHINVRAPLTRLLRKVPRIESVVIKEPAITLEQGLTSSNLYELLNRTANVQEAGPEVKVVIGTLRIDGAKVRIVPRVAGVPATFVPLPPLELKELGGEGNQGVTMAQTLAFSLREIIRSTVANGGGLISPELGASLTSGLDAVSGAGQQITGVVSEAGTQAVGAARGAVEGFLNKAVGIKGAAGNGK